MLVVLACACGPGRATTSGTEGCTPGAEGCPCAADGCDGGLECQGEVCLPAPGSSGMSGTSGASDMSDATTAASTSTGVETVGTITTAGTSASGPDGTTSCEFICNPPDVGGCGLGVRGVASQCDVWSQDCPAGEKCAAFDCDLDSAWDATRCVEVTGDGQPGEPCTAEGGATGVDDCAKGVMCWYLDEDGHGTCVALCAGAEDNPQCAPGTLCQISNMGVLNLCLPSCDPIMSNCPEGQTCAIHGDAEGFVCHAGGTGGAPPGTPCDNLAACDPGSFCTVTAFAPFESCQDASGCCTAYCDLNAGDGPCQALEPSFVCVPWFEMGQAPPGLEHIGACGVPG